jgi:hypothetical protein
MDEKGKLNTKLDFVHNYKQSYIDGTTTTQYVTHLRSISINSIVDNDNIRIELPGIYLHMRKFMDRKFLLKRL